MGTKYTSQSISGYNATPPDDDGTVSEANKGKWSTVKSKLSDPVKTLVEAINTALVAHVDVGPDQKTIDYTTVAGDHGKTIECDISSGTLTLMDASTAPTGYTVTVKNINSTALTVSRATGADTLDDVAADVILPTNARMVVQVTADADGYNILSGGLTDRKTFTPTLIGDSGTTGGYTTQDGYIYVMGPMRYVRVELEISSKGTVSGDLKIDGIPDTVETVSSCQDGLNVSFFSGANITAGYDIKARTTTSDSIHLVLTDGTSTTSPLQDSEITDTFRIMVSGWYVAE